MKGYETKEEIQTMYEKARRIYKDLTEWAVWRDDVDPPGVYTPEEVRKIRREATKAKIRTKPKLKPKPDLSENRLLMAKRLEKGCVLCGKFQRLQFHHFYPQDKLFEIGRGVDTKSTDKFRKELNKCFVLCGSCHKRIHGKNPPNEAVQNVELYYLIQEAANGKV